MDFYQSNVLSMTGNSDFATTTQLANYIDKTTNQTITSGIKTFNVLPQSAVVPTTANQLVNKTYVDGAFVTLGTTQTITGAKTINANLRLNNTRQLIFGTSYPTAGGVITYTTPNLYYDVAGGGYHNFFVGGLPSVDIDSGGLVLRTGKKVQFFAGSTIDENSGGNSFDTNIPSGFTYKFKINSVDKLSLHTTFGATFADNVNIQSDKYLNFNGGSYLQEQPSFTNLIYNVPTTFKHQFRINNFDAVNISSDTNGTLMTFQSGTIMREYTSFNWFLYQLPATYALIYQVAGNNIMEVSTGGVTMYEAVSLRDGKKVIWDEGFTNIAYIRKDTTTSTLDYEVATGYKHKFMVNSVTQLLLDATDGATFAGYIRMKVAQRLVVDDVYLGGGISSYGSGGIRFDSDTGSSGFLFVDDSITTLGINFAGTTLPSNSVAQFGVNDCNISYQAGTTSLRYKVPTGTYYHRWFSGTTELMSLSSVAFYGLRTTDIDIFLTRNKHFYMDTSNNGIWIDLSGNLNLQANSGTGRNNFYTGATLGAFVNASGITMVDSGILTFGTTIATNNIGVTATTLQYNVPSGSTHNFRTAGSTRAFVGVNGLTLPVNNSTITIGASSVCDIKQDTATTAFRLDAPFGYTHRLRIAGVTQLQVLTGGLQITGGYYTKLGSGGAFQTSVFNNAWTFPNYTAYIDGTNIGNYVLCDARLKKNIVKARPILDRLCNLSMIEYTYIENGIFKDDGIRHYGYIAQEIKKEFAEFPNFTTGEETDMTEDGHIQPIRVNSEFSNIFMGAIQELNAKVEMQQKQIEAQQAQIDGLLVAMSKLVSQQIV